MTKKRLVEEGFLDHFSGLEDPRSERNRLHTMAEILLTTLAAGVCGAEGWQDVEDFGRIKVAYLRQFLPFKNGIPSDDTFRRFFRALNPEIFQGLFRSWVQSFQPDLQAGVIAIDGKSSRRSFDGDEKMLHMVSAYATEARLVLGQEKVSEKSNEIRAIPKLLTCLDLKGSTVTIDAMGCQYKIADQIVHQEGDYIFALKGNQSTLNDDVRLYLNDVKNEATFSYDETYDKGHGRIERRECWVSYDVEWLKEQHPHWSTIQSLIRIKSTRELKGKSSSEIRWYISSLKKSAADTLPRVRSHWAIENNLHWVLDMSFGEDQSRIRKHNAPQNMAIVRHMALNLLQLTKETMKRMSIKRLRKIAGWDDMTLSVILGQRFS